MNPKKAVKKVTDYNKLQEELDTRMYVSVYQRMQQIEQKKE